METRTIEKQISDIENQLKDVNLNENLIKSFNKELDIIREMCEESLVCPISLEYFSTENQPYTILTPGDGKKTVVTKKVKESLFEKKFTKDPSTTLNIIGFEENHEWKKRLTEIEKHLGDLEIKINKMITLAKQKNESEALLSKVNQMIESAQAPLQKFSYAEIGPKTFTLQITTTNSKEAFALAETLGKKWNLPISTNDNIITILPSKGIGHTGIYLSRNEQKPEIAIAFKDQNDRNEFGKTFALSNNDCILMPGWGAGLNAVYFTQSSLKKVIPQALIANNSSTLFSSSVKPTQQEELKILLSNTGKNELAVEFPNEETALKFLELIKVDKYKIKDKDGFKDVLIPNIKDDHPNTFFFPTYTAYNGEFTAIFSSSKMCDLFFDLIIKGKDKVKTNAFSRQNGTGDYVIHFRDPIFFMNGKLSLSISDELKVQESASLLMKKN